MRDLAWRTLLFLWASPEGRDPFGKQHLPISGHNAKGQVSLGKCKSPAVISSDMSWSRGVKERKLSGKILIKSLPFIYLS